MPGQSRVATADARAEGRNAVLGLLSPGGRRQQRELDAGQVQRSNDVGEAAKHRRHTRDLHENMISLSSTGTEIGKTLTIGEPTMALTIKRPEAEKLARRLARKTGETITEAVTKALREKLARE